MFEQYESFYRPKKSGWVRLAISASVIAHVGAALALIINAAWKLDKLRIQDPQLSIASIGLPAAAPPALASERRERVKVKIRRTEDVTQKSDATQNRDEPAGGGSEGTADGDADGVGNSQGNTVGAPSGTVCPNGKCLGIDTTMAPPEPPKAKKPTLVPHKLIKGLLISGTTQVHPDSKTRTAIYRANQDKLHGIVRACIGKTGSVTSATVIRSTNYKAYDARLLASVRRWRYRPYKVNGSAVPVCTVINFIYKVTGQ